MGSSAINLTNSVLDVGAIVDNLIYVEAAPMRQMQSQVTTLESKASAYQNLNTMLSALSDKINHLLFGKPEAPFNPPGTFAGLLSESIFARASVTSSNEEAVSATGSNATTGGSYSISVTSLAQAQSMASSGFADASTGTGTGTFTITKAGADPVVITIDETNATLSGMRAAINNANAGVTATIVNTGAPDTPYRLLIRADETGTAGAFTISENLAGGQAPGFVQTEAAADAQFVVNGLSVTKSSNTVSDVIEGVTFTLKSVTTSPVTLSIEKDADAIVEAFKEFVSAYNNVASFINQQFTYDAKKETSGVLAGDSTLRRIQSTLQRQITQSVANPFSTLGVAGQVGLEFNRDGTLTLNETELRDALAADFKGVAALFLGGATEGSGTVPDGQEAGGNSILMGLFSALDGITDPLSGPIHHATDGLNRSIRSINERIDSYQERLDKRREMLTQQMNEADEALRLMSVMQAQLSSQISSLSSQR